MKLLYAFIAFCLLISYTTFSQSTTDCSVSCNPSSACSGNDITLTCFPNIGTGKSVTSYTWNGPDNFTSSVKSPTISNVSSKQQGVYTIKIITDIGCTAITTTFITIQESPSNPIVAKADRSVLCEGSSVTLSANCLADTQKQRWYDSNNTLLKSTTFIPPVGKNTYFSGCQTIIYGCETITSNRVTVSVVVNANNIEGGEISNGQTYCGENDPIAFKSIKPASGNTTGIEYLWLKIAKGITKPDSNDPNWVAIAGTNGETYDPSVLKTTTSFMRVARSVGCTDYTGSSNISTITINPIPTITVQNTLSVCRNELVALTADSKGVLFKWTGPDSFTSTQQSPTFQAKSSTKQSGNYSVIVTNTSGCTNSATIAVTVKDPVAFTVPKEISVCEGGTLLIELKNQKLTDSTEKVDLFEVVDPFTRTSRISFNYGYIQIENFMLTQSGIYKITGKSYNYLNSCETTQDIKINVDKGINCKSIEIEPMQDIKMCYGQEVSIPFKTKGNFKQGTKFKVYILNSGEPFNIQKLPNAIVEKSPIVLRSIPEQYNDRKIQIYIVTDDSEKVSYLSNVRAYTSPREYFDNYISNVNFCDSAKLSISNFSNLNSVQWLQDGKVINKSINKDFIVKQSGAFTFQYRITNPPYNPIDKTCLYESQPVKIELGKIPKPYIYIDNDVELCVGKPATLNVYSNNNPTYRWKKDGNYIANATSKIYETLQEGKYQVEAKEGTCTAVSDTVFLKKPKKLVDEIYFSIDSNTPVQGSQNQDVYTLCNNQEFYFVSDRVSSAKHQLFKNLQLIKETPDRTDFNFSPIKGEGTYYLKAIYGSCEAVSRPITVKYSTTIRAQTYLQNNNLDWCEGSSANFKLAFNGSNNYKLGDGFVYKNGNIIRNWFKYQDENVNYYSDAEPNSEAGSYYAIGKAIFPDKSECLIKTDTVKVKFSKRVFQDISDISDPSQNNLFTINTCKDSTEIQAYNNIGAYGRQTAYKWIKDGTVLKQDSSSILKATQAGTYQLETTYKGGCTVVSVPYKVEFGKIKVDLVFFDRLPICDGDSYEVYPNFSEYSDKNIYSIFKDGKIFKENAELIFSPAYYGYFNLTQSGTYKLKVANGKCEGTSPDFTLKVDKIPTNITPSDSVTFCAGKTVELKTSTEAGLSYIWERNGSVISQANQANYTANADGLYKATLLRGACWGITPSVKLKSLANIIPTATLTGDKKIDYDTETKLSINLTSYAPWTFKLSDGKEYTATKSPFEVSVKPLSTTTYSVTEVKNICGTGTVSGSAKIEIIILSAEEEKELNVEVFPVPSSEICHWKIETPQATTASVLMYDVLGVTQYSQASSTRTQSHEGIIDLTNMKSGTYFLKLQAGDKSVIRKVMKY